MNALTKATWQGVAMLAVGGIVFAAILIFAPPGNIQLVLTGSAGLLSSLVGWLTISKPSDAAKIDALTIRPPPLPAPIADTIEGSSR